MDEGSALLMPDEDGPAITEATALADGEGGGTYKTPIKWVIPVATSANTHSL
jgi:hypothetical protein